MRKTACWCFRRGIQTQETIRTNAWPASLSSSSARPTAITLVLFTSYDQMGHVYERLEGRLPVPLFKAPRGGQWFVEQFKRCDNAVLLAGGPCWEGIDFPGDRVSLLVIVRLPFPVPDPVREARRQQYPRPAQLHSDRDCARYAAEAAAGFRPCHPHRDRQFARSPSWTRGQPPAGDTTKQCWSAASRYPGHNRNQRNANLSPSSQRPGFFLPDFKNDSKTDGFQDEYKIADTGGKKCEPSALFRKPKIPI